MYRPRPNMLFIQKITVTIDVKRGERFNGAE